MVFCSNYRSRRIENNKGTNLLIHLKREKCTTSKLSGRTLQTCPTMNVSYGSITAEQASENEQKWIFGKCYVLCLAPLDLLETLKRVLRSRGQAQYPVLYFQMRINSWCRARQGSRFLGSSPWFCLPYCWQAEGSYTFRHFAVGILQHTTNAVFGHFYINFNICS